MQRALELHRQGDLRAAAQEYERLLQSAPATAEAWHMLGVLSHQLGKNELAITCIRRAVELDPIQAAYHSNLGVVYRAQGQLTAAVGAYRLAILRKPDYVEAYANLGQALGELGEFDDAERQLAEALRLQPSLAQTHYHLGQIHQRRQRLDAAIDAYRTAVQLQPQHIEAWNNLGVALKNQGRFAEAAEALETALSINPQLAEAWYNLAQARHAQGHLVEAVEFYQRFLQVRPDYAVAHNNLGNVLEDLGQVDESIACFREALRLRPEMVEAHNNLGHAFQVQGRLNEAEEQYRAALKLVPEHDTVLSNLLFFLNYQPKLKQEELLAEHRKWDELPIAKAPRYTLQRERSPERKLRIGYVSPDLRSHPVGSFMESVLAYHDKEMFETFLYADVAVPDLMSRQLEQLAGHWQQTRWLDHDALGEQIMADKIDILVDLAGHTAVGRLPLFARKPAPVQVTYLGYPNTTGLQAIDYRLTDTIADPPDEPNLHSEQLVRLEPSFACYAPPTSAPEVSELPFQRNQFITFGSLHALSKLNFKVLDLWSKVLKTVVNSRLLITRDTLHGLARDRLIAEFKKREIGRDRLIVDHELEPGQSHLAFYHQVDIALDTFPWSGHTTACESLWMGVPVITLRGSRHAGRMVASLLTTLGRADWIGDTTNNYVQIARRLAKETAALAETRSTLREQLRVSGVCDGARFTRSLEAAYRQMWRDWCAQETTPGTQEAR